MQERTKFVYHPSIKLFTDKIVSREDADRQERTAKEILKRLNTQPGLILADEVGMGKTFVALATAVSTFLSDREKRPVVVMVPPGLQSKWIDDFASFKACIHDVRIQNSICHGSAENAEEFLKFMDDPIVRRKTIVFLKYGAMSSGLTDGWVKIALIRRALRGRHHIDDLYSSLAKFGVDLVRLKAKEKNLDEKRKKAFWSDIYNNHPSKWMSISNRHEFLKEKMTDDPVPSIITDAIENLDTSEVEGLFESLRDNLPRKESSRLDERIKTTRELMSKILQRVWKTVLKELNVSSPLLILDEAHHLKNSGTNLAKSFYSPESQEDAEVLKKGNLDKVFDRILFLTATPFQLGHKELINILERFKAIKWRTLQDYDRLRFDTDLRALEDVLNKSQIAGMSLDKAWGKITQEEVTNLPSNWWNEPVSEHDSERISAAKKYYQETYQTMRNTEKFLRPWVIRHLRPRSFAFNDQLVHRRQIYEGAGIQNDVGTMNGLEILADQRFPFLLASRAVATSPQTRPVFAEGLASSYEAFIDTRKSKSAFEIQDEEEDLDITEDKLMSFYLNQIQSCLEREEGFIKMPHPKIDVTVEKAIRLWEQGEKVLIFCHYFQTGRALRHHLSKRMNQLILNKAAARLKVKPEDAKKRLTTLGRSIDKQTSLIESYVQELLDTRVQFENLIPHKVLLSKILKRMIRTPNFLSRYYPLEKIQKGQEATKDFLQEALTVKDASQMSFHDLMINFFEFLSIRHRNIDKYLEALEKIKTGSIFNRDEKEDDLDQAEINPHAQDESNSGVRLANGVVKLEARRQLMLAFNTPFIPDILIASSVMAEGVDLHLNCRYIIHHDLSWNPSTIEQRTGRVDRIGAKVETSGKPIQSYLPYLAATQDEKMFRVVMDRERWFKVVMGDKVKIDSAFEIEKNAERIPFPNEAADKLSLNLAVLN